jgi:hypothetical protein
VPDTTSGAEAPSPAHPRRRRRRGAIATGAAVLALGGAIAAVIIRAASIGMKKDR